MLRLWLPLAALYLLSAPLIQADELGSTDELSWSTDSVPASRFLAVHGRRAATFGYSRLGLESWAYPVQILTSFSVSFRRPDTVTEIDGQAILRRVVYRPEAVTRIYVGPDFVVRERIFVPLEQPGTVITYAVEGRHPVDVVARFTPVLDLMWPAAIGGQQVAWDAERSGYVLSEPTNRYSAVVSSRNIVAHDELHNSNKAADSKVAMVIRAAAGHTARIEIASGGAGAPFDGLDDHYKQLLAASLQIETPDQEVNRALLWSQIAVDQAWVCAPGFGCGQVAGYGPSRRGRRPQYAWFFAGDGLVSTEALIASGQYKAAREELEFILRYQDRKSGMIWHELTQSAATLNWTQLPYMYVHPGITADFLATVAGYYRTSGDREFVTKHWQELQRTYRYSRSLLSVQGLPQIPADKQGANEQDPLGDELSLSAGWVAAAEGFAELAAATGHPAEAREARAAAQRARPAIAARYWDESRHYWISGHTRSGEPAHDREARPASTVAQNLFSPAQRATALDQLAAADFQTDWGTRGRPSTDPRYDPNAYASGSVWAIGSAEVAGAFWADHRPLTALPIWNALVPWSSLDSLGHMHETLAGDFYHDEMESVPEQTWSSAAFFTTTVRGLLGLSVDGVANRLTFAPHLPPQWGSVAVSHLHVGSSALTLRLTQSPTEIQLQVHNQGAPVSMQFNPQLPLGATGEHIITNQQDTHARVELAIPAGDSTHTVRFAGGVSVIPAAVPATVGEASRGFKITGLKLRDRTLTLDLDRVSADAASFELRTPWKIRDVSGATFIADGHFTVQGAPGHHQVIVNFGS